MTLPTPFAINADTLTLRALRRTVFSIGSNLGDRWDHLEEAVLLLRNTPDLRITGVSPVYETRAVGGPADSPDFLNAVVVADTIQPAEALLARAGAIEDAADRTREVHWGPRTLDVDIIVYGDEVINTPDLTVPHPYAHQRAFVLAPWADVEPDAILPGHGPIRDLLAQVDTSGIHRLAETLDE